MNIAVKLVKGSQKNRINGIEMLAIVINAIFSVKKVLQVCGGGCSGTTHNQPGARRSGVVVPGARTVLHCTALYCTAPYTSHCQTLSPRREVAGVTLHITLPCLCQ